MKNLVIEIGIGEALDRLSILTIKVQRIEDTSKRALAKLERHRLMVRLGWAGIVDMPETYDALLLVNCELWDVEDKIRKALAADVTESEEEFAFLAKQVPDLNDERARLKRAIDEHYGSEIREVKSYV